VYFAASVDTPATNKRFARSLGVDFLILSDPAKQVAKAYGVVDEDQPFAARWTFYIGIDGRILYIDKQGSATTQGQTIVDKLGELRIPKRHRPTR
jgi:peroxiredoxin Q/BCP